MASLAICRPCEAWADTTLAEGIKLFGQKDYAKAFYAFETAKKDPSCASQASYYQAMCYLSMGQTDYARQMFKNTISAYPGSSSAVAAKAALEKLGGGSIETQTTGAGSAAAATRRFAESGYKRDSFGRMIVSVRVNDKINYPMLLDTGADVCSLSIDQARQAGIDMTRAIGKATLKGTSGETQARIYRAQLQVGSMVKNVDVYVSDRGHSDLALLGRNFFSDVALEVDDTTRTIKFLDPKEIQVGTESAIVPYRTNGHGMFVTAKINGRECEMVFDTGCSTTSFSDKQWSGMGLSFAAGEAGSGRTGGLGGQRDAHFVNIGTVELGGIIKYRVPAAVSIYGASDKPLLGMSFLQGLKYVVNPYEQKIYISK